MDHSKDNSIDYYREREEHERKLAEAASSPEIRRIHLEMADNYQQLVEILGTSRAQD